MTRVACCRIAPERDRRPRGRRTHPDRRLRLLGPAGVGIDRATYFERCWPNSQTTAKFEYVRLFEANDEVVVTYEATRTDGTRFRNTEIFGFDGDRISRVEVYFGWNL
jgi:hypothetical protein